MAHVYPKPCNYGGHQKYGTKDLPAVHLVRSTCPFCDRFKIYEVCDQCLKGVYGSGLFMKCGDCGDKQTPTQKLEHWIRMGDL